MEERLRAVEMQSASAAQQISAHERVCAVRYAGIEAAHKAMRGDIRGINATLRWAATALITGMTAILVKLFFLA